MFSNKVTLDDLIDSTCRKLMGTYMSRFEPLSDCYIMQNALSWQEPITFQWDDDDVQVVLDQRIFN